MPEVILSEDELSDLIPNDDPTPQAISAAETEDTPPELPQTSPELPLTPTRSLAAEDDDDSFIEEVNRETSSGTEVIRKPWMQYHYFTLVTNIDEVKQIVDDALAHGRCALDLETEGLDSRIDYQEGVPKTKHKVVGFCLSVRGHGYYVPIRHKFDSTYDKNPNLPPEEVEAEIKRLCLASQPVITEAGRQKDPYASTDWEVPPRVIIYFWNSKFDQEFLFPITGIDFWHPDSFEDGLLAAYVWYTDDKKLGLKLKASSRLAIQDHPYDMITMSDLFDNSWKKHERDFSILQPGGDPNVVYYGCSDAICTELLCESEEVEWDLIGEGEDLKLSYQNVLSPVKKRPFQRIYRLEKQCVQAIRVMERSRTLLDKEAARELLEEAYVERDSYQEKIVNIAKGNGFINFNPGSSQQLSRFLFTSEGLDLPDKPDKTKSGQYKTDADTLERMVKDNPEAPKVLKDIVMYRQVDKVIGTYLISLAKNTDEFGQLRFQFKQTGAATGRFSAPQGEPEQGYAGVPIHGIPAKSDPNRPKVANSIRRLFIAHPGYTLIKIDYAGEELRVVTNISKEPLWLNEFKNGTGDLHTLTAQAFFGPHITKADKKERTAGKIANFSLIYGGGVQAIQRATKCDKHEAARKKKSFDASVPVFAKWVKRQHAYVKKHLGVFTGFGRFIRIPDANIKPGEVPSRGGPPVADEKEARKIRAGCERKSTNFPIQGSAADILKIVFVRLVKDLHRRGWLKNGGDDSVRMLLTVHDEIVFEVRDDRVPEALPILVAIMQAPSSLIGWPIPLIVEPLLGRSWDAKYDWLDILKGKAELPEWLIPHFEAYQRSRPKSEVQELLPPPVPREAASTAPSKPKPKEPQKVAPKAPRAEPEASREVSVRSTSEIALFQLTGFLARRTVQIMRRAIFMAEPVPIDGDWSTVDRTVYKRLRVIDPQGLVYIQTDLNILVNPEILSQEISQHNLGSGDYCLIEE